ncbi:MAG TPA: twin-arginine translocase TatA/TatE family subunit [Bacteroidales bacterium]|nr:twin-arginine translocase TatA/TatE family subunit [Bacteroidales bacterium]HRZ21527.1 twin-arginine translocase TatA/TatE family subunit [Bacteroidales bacterium]
MTVLLFLDVGGGEILLILVVVFLIFGPSKLPEMSRKLGKTMNDLKRASNDIRREIQQGANEVTGDFKEAKKNITEDPFSNDQGSTSNEPGQKTTDQKDDQMNP